jgi:Rap1a immunity proteins
VATGFKRPGLVYILAVVGALVTLSTVHAAVYFNSGSDLYEACQLQDDPFARGVCTATISGAYDMMVALGYVCSGLPEGVTRNQLRDVVINYLRDHPETRNSPAVLNIALAMKAAFNCKAPETTP